MRKVLSFLCAAVLVLGLLPAAALAGSAGDFSLGKSVTAVDGSGTTRSLDSLRAGDTVTVSVSIPADKAICSVGIHITFDKTKFDCAGIVTGNAISAVGWSNTTVSSASTANATGYAAISTIHLDDDDDVSNTTTAASAPTLCTATFTVKSGVSGTASFGVEAIELGHITSGTTTALYSVTAPSPQSVTIKTALSAVLLSALNIDFGQATVNTVGNGTGYTSSVSWTRGSDDVTGNTISLAGTYTATVTLTTSGYYVFTDSALVSYGGTALDGTAQIVNNCSAEITSQTASQIVLTVSRTISAPITASTAYTETASGSTTKIATTAGTKKSATVTFSNTLSSSVTVTVANDNQTNFSIAAAAGSVLTGEGGNVLTVPASGSAAVVVTLNASTASDYTTTISGTYAYGGISLTADTAVTGTVTAATTGGGGGGGGGGSTDEEEDTPTPVTLGDVVAAVTENGSTAELSFSDEDMAATLGNTTDGNLTVNLSDYIGVSAVTLPAAAAAAVGSSSNSLTIQTDTYTMQVSNQVISELSEQLGTHDKLTFSAVAVGADQLSEAQRAALHENAIILDLNAIITVCDANGNETGETRHGSFSGEVSVSIPYTLAAGQDAGALVVYRLKSDGTMDYLPAVYENGRLSFMTDSFSIYVAAGCPMVTYEDCDLNAWYHTAIDYALEAGIMTGTGASTFSPNDSTTRAMIVTVLWRLAGQPDGYSAAFTDLTADWYNDAVGWAFSSGITTGISDTSFNPDGVMTREQFAALLYRYAQTLGYDVSAQADLRAYSDAGTISNYAADSVRWAVSTGIITGRTETTIAPAGAATRAEMAAMLMRFSENVLN